MDVVDFFQISSTQTYSLTFNSFNFYRDKLLVTQQL